MKFISRLYSIFFLITSLALSAQEVIPLWPQGVPGAIADATYVEKIVSQDEVGRPTRIGQVTQPTLTLYHPTKEKATGAAVLICPGGGYGILAIQHEGVEVAEWLNSLGITAAILKYRLPSSQIMEDQKIGPLQDAQRGLRMLRENASKWGFQPNKIGVLGFSAGGHLASTLSTHYKAPVYDHSGLVSARPDFSILIYPVISFKENLYHRGTRRNLLEKQETPSQIHRFSNEEWVDKNTPKTFLVHSIDDGGVPVENSFVYALALKKHGVAVELHAYQKGGHGYGLGRNNTEKNWPEACARWLKNNGIMD